MNLKERIAITILFLASYLLLPLIILNFYSAEDISKAGFVILLTLAFISFAINLVVTYLKGKKIEVPLLSSLLSLPLFYIFNTSAYVPVIAIVILSFLAYFLGGLFTNDTNSHRTN